VLLNLSDAPLLESKIVATSNKPVVLPVIYTKGDANIDVNATQYPCILKFKDKNKNPVAVIDQVMDDRIKGKPVECNWSKKI
jgi:hypothetical protein